MLCSRSEAFQWVHKCGRRKRFRTEKFPRPFNWYKNTSERHYWFKRFLSFRSLMVRRAAISRLSFNRMGASFGIRDGEWTPGWRRLFLFLRLPKTLSSRVSCHGITCEREGKLGSLDSSESPISNTGGWYIRREKAKPIFRSDDAQLSSVSKMAIIRKYWLVSSDHVASFEVRKLCTA